MVTEVARPVVLDDDKTYQLVTVKRRNGGVVSRDFLSGKDILVKNYYEIHAGDYLISKRQVVHGANGYVPEDLDGAVVSNEYMVLVSNDDISTEYWTLISKHREMYKMFMLSSYGVDIEKLVFNVEDWKRRQLHIPSVQEQRCLVSFFSRLDSLITLHQRKQL
ncbi:restriction endonuclease subunit S [Bifidobacterium sp. 82T24]|nr:restriction endonuclease subunit S [Bifidobacterium pluvialisilvae]